MDVNSDLAADALEGACKLAWGSSLTEEVIDYKSQVNLARKT